MSKLAEICRQVEGERHRLLIFQQEMQARRQVIDLQTKQAGRMLGAYKNPVLNQLFTSFEEANRRLEVSILYMQKASFIAADWICKIMTYTPGIALPAMPDNDYRKADSGSFPLKTERSTLWEDHKKTNPKYSSDNMSYSYNCQRCVTTYEARRRGFDVESLPITDPQDLLARDNPMTGWPSVYENRDTTDCSAGTAQNVRERIASIMAKWGEGARAVVRIYWRDEYGGGGHVFSAEQNGGEIIYIEPQNPDKLPSQYSASSYFDLARTEDVVILRTDNNPFTERFRLCCKPREEQS